MTGLSNCINSCLKSFQIISVPLSQDDTYACTQVKSHGSAFPVIIHSVNSKIKLEITCEQALFSFRSVKHSGGTGETKNRA